MTPAAKRDKTRNRIIDLFIETQPRAWIERPPAISADLWSYHLRKLEAEGCMVEKRHVGHRIVVRQTMESHAAWVAAGEQADVERGHLSPEDAAFSAGDRGVHKAELDIRPSGRAAHKEYIDSDGEKRTSVAVENAGWYDVAEIGDERRLPFSVRLRVNVGADGRLVVTDLELRGGEITARGLRALPLGELLKKVGAKRSLNRPLPRVGRPPLDKEFLEKVAAAYREAVAHNPRNPYAYLLDPSRITDSDAIRPPNRSTASRWVSKAREEGVLGPRVPGKAGELPADDEEADDHDEE